MAKVGIMHSGSPETGQKEIDTLTTRLKQKYTKSLTIDGPHYPSPKDSLSKIAKHLIDNNVDVLIAGGGSRSAHAAMQSRGSAKRPIIVFTSVAPYILNGIDPAITTGLDAHTSDHDGKRLEWLLEMLQSNGPTIGVLRNSNRGDAPNQLNMINGAAKGKCSLVDADINGPLTIRKAFDLFQQQAVDALLVAADPFFFRNRQEVVETANEVNYPAIYQWREFVEIGGLISFGPNLQNLYAQAAQMVADILNSTTNPRTIPPVRDVQDAEFELVVSQARSTHFSMWPLPTAVQNYPPVILP